MKYNLKRSETYIFQNLFIGTALTLNVHLYRKKQKTNFTHTKNKPVSILLLCPIILYPSKNIWN